MAEVEQYDVLPNGDEVSGAEEKFCGTSDVCEALGESEQDFGGFVSDARRSTQALLDDPAAPDHIKRDAHKDLDELLPVVKCRRKEHGEIECGVGRRQYLFTIPQLWRVKLAMHPAMEKIFYEDANGNRCALLAPRDALPQPRVGGRMAAWTSEMLAGGSDRYLPKGWANQLDQTEPVIYVKLCRSE